VITLTPSAATKVKDLIAAEGTEALALRVAVRPGGCSGFSYEMFFDTDVAADDRLTEDNGVRVVVDEASAELLQGATLDYKDGLQGAGFAI
jgi:iron-sulfur cluster insertion protein